MKKLVVPAEVISVEIGDMVVFMEKQNGREEVYVIAPVVNIISFTVSVMLTDRTVHVVPAGNILFSFKQNYLLRVEVGKSPVSFVAPPRSPLTSAERTQEEDELARLACEEEEKTQAHATNTN